MNPRAPWNPFACVPWFMDHSTGNVLPNLNQPPIYHPLLYAGRQLTGQSPQTSFQNQPYRQPSLTECLDDNDTISSTSSSRQLPINHDTAGGTESEQQYSTNAIGGHLWLNNSFANHSQLAVQQPSQQHILHRGGMMDPSQSHNSVTFMQPAFQTQNGASQSLPLPGNYLITLENQIRKSLRMSLSGNVSTTDHGKISSDSDSHHNPFMNQMSTHGGSVIQEKIERQETMYPDHRESMSEGTNSMRYWRYLDTKRKIPSRAMTISLMSYNVLAQSLLEEHGYLYGDCYTEDLKWSSRRAALIKQFKHHKSDILCLQEVQEDHWNTFFQPELKSLGYEGHFTKRSGDKPDGCAVLFRRKKFKLIEFVPISFQRGGLLDRDNVGIILLLKPRKGYYRGSMRRICVATTHLLFNPRRGDVKLAQLMLFLAEIEKCSYLDSANTSSQSNISEHNSSTSVKHPYCPVILCGDMNLEPRSDLYDFLMKGHIKYNRCISQSLSGQSEGWGRSQWYVDTELLPQSLGINEHCQYIRHALKRVPLDVSSVHKTSDCTSGESSHANDSEHTNEGEINHVSSYNKRDQRTLMNTGHASHNFNFKSVYPAQHDLVTTHHGRASCMVDYIFYSSDSTTPSCDYNKTVDGCTDKISSKYKVNKRKRTESMNSDNQNAVISVHKTLKSEVEQATYSCNGVEKQEKCAIVYSSEEKSQSQNENAPSQTLKTNDARINNSHCPEPGEIVPPEDCIIISSDDNVSDSLSEMQSVVSISSHPDESDTGIASMDKHNNDDMRVYSPTPLESGEKNVSIQTLELLGYWSLLSSKDFRKLGSLPNKVFPSDHTCLIAKFLLH